VSDSVPKKLRRPRAVDIELIQDISKISSPVEGFLRRHRHRAKTVLEDGTRTDVYVADFVDRDPYHRHAVGAAVYSRPARRKDVGSARVLLRRQVRYALYLMTKEPLCTEVVAGLQEGDESPEATAVREVDEEAGITASTTDVRILGNAFFVLPGTLTEQITPVAVEVPEETLLQAVENEISGDGSPFEEGAELVSMTLDQALSLIDAPARHHGSLLWINDAKTELILLRLQRFLRASS
jgi:8-oxo-dGTP pyrophosphatase MutT (NUDIX family)